MTTATKGAIKNFHLPLPQRVYDALRAGTAADLDPFLERASLELLRGKKPRR